MNAWFNRERVREVLDSKFLYYIRKAIMFSFESELNSRLSNELKIAIDLESKIEDYSPKGRSLRRS